MTSTYLILIDNLSVLFGGVGVLSPVEGIGIPKAHEIGLEDITFSLHVADLTQAEAEELSLREGVIVAPSMPVKLIEPLSEVEAPPEALGEGVAWGVRAVQAHGEPSTLTGQGITVAVLDTGIDSAHPAFSGVQLTLQNFTSDVDHDVRGHGTHCAGTIFGRDVDGFRIGIARGVTRALIGKVIGERGGESGQIAKAIEWAAGEGAHVISMSIGIDFPGYVDRRIHSNVPAAAAVNDALQAYRKNLYLFDRIANLVRLTGNPTLLIAGAGNESRLQDVPPLRIGVSLPAASDGFISVAALEEGPNGCVVAPFSNVEAIVSAPGVGVISAFPGGGLKSMSGTSMATPHVAGVAALWAEHLRNGGLLNAVQFYVRVIGSATMDGVDANQSPQDVGGGKIRAP